MNTDERWLAFTGVDLLDGTRAPGPDEVVLLARLPRADAAGPVNTVVLEWAALPAVPVVAVTADGRRTRTVDVPAAELMSGVRVGPALTALLSELDPVAARRTYAPSFQLGPAGTGAVHVHSRIRLRREDCCLIRITAQPVPTTGVPRLDWLPPAVAAHAAEAVFLNNHHCYYRKCFADRELEYKYTLRPPVDIWAATARLYDRLRAGGLPGYLMEYADEFQTWDYLNHLFEVPAPADEQGYVSFIPSTDGRHLMKRKWFAEDSFERREEHRKGVVTGNDLGRFVAEQLGLRARRLPTFRRVRYDVNVESARTGHVYGIFFDHCSLVADPTVVLSQCELEYLRTRSVLPPDEAAVRVELDEIAAWLEAFLAESGLPNERGYYSKLSFLRDVVAARPELAVVPG
ncbi:hypothetical protein [Micromonospora humi]|uniref:Uncharacterized protein n=1 Tax=Micromonospora humi TaxID=745366 RepID=A0A1C5JP39_9ACTN|nr:hypothetical protein [Micromonospora humi]SCG72355.1 hypothetical protein GA0070213_112172 [Micromonospora humi]